jgi:hypothetical protein
MLYVYALARAPAKLPAVNGIGDVPLALETVDGLDAVVSAHDAPVEPSQAAALAHGHVVTEVAAVNAAVLPVRFGGVYEAGTTLRDELRRRREAFRAALERVEGCVELGLRVVGQSSEAPHDAIASGSEYMRARLGERQRAERAADSIDAPLAALARERVRSVGATPGLLLSASYLVERASVEGFLAAVARAQDEHPDLSIVCTGPWPAFSFATADVGGA